MKRTSRLAFSLSLFVGMLISTPNYGAEPDPRIPQIEKLTQQMLALRKEGKLTDSIAVAKRRLALVREVVGSEYTESVAGSHELLAQLLEENGQLAEAVDRRKAVVKIRHQFQGENHAKTNEARAALSRVERLAQSGPNGPRQLAEADAWMVKALDAMKARKFADALDANRRALQLQRAALGDKAVEIADRWEMEAFCLQMLGEYVKSERAYEECLQRRRALLGDNHIAVARAYNGLANVEFSLGKLKENVAAREKAIGIFRETVGLGDDEGLAALKALSSSRLLLGKLTAAREAQQEVLGISREKYGAASREVCVSLMSLVSIAISAGDPLKAKQHLDEVATIAKELNVPSDPTQADLAKKIGDSFQTVRDPRAKDWLKIAQGLYASRPDEGGVSALQCALGLVKLELEPGVSRWEREREILKQLLQSYQNAEVGRVPPIEIASVLGELGLLSFRLGDLANATDYLREALSIRNRDLAIDVSGKSMVECDLALVLAARGQWNEATDHMDIARKESRKYCRQGLWSLTDREQLNFLRRNDRLAFFNGVSIALAAGKSNPANPTIVGKSAEWVLNGKGATLEILSQRQMALRTASDPQTKAAFRDLAVVRHEIGRLSEGSPTPNSASPLSSLLERQSELERLFASAHLDNQTSAPWVTLEAVRDSIPPGSVLVEIVRFIEFNFAAKPEEPWSKPARYAAWIIKGTGQKDVALIDLGEAAPIEQAITQLTEAIAQSREQIVEIGEADAEAELRPHLQRVADTVLGPILPKIKDSPQWILSLDSALWTVPWIALPLPDGRYAVEEHEIRYVNSGRNLVAQGKKRAPRGSGGGAILADPIFDKGASQTGQASHPKSDAARTSRFPNTWKRLPETAAEAQAVAPMMSSYLRQEPRLFLGEKATEAAFQSASRPRVLLLSTHGFQFAEAGEIDDRKAMLALLTADESATSDVVPNPLSQCGLVLTGANHYQEAARADQDGILTGLEIVQADLQGTELVMLSACDTSLGEIRNGEGLAGLREAFLQAGADAVIATLWKIPSEASVDLVSEFWKNVREDKSKSAALRQAQLAVLAKRRSGAGKSGHPLFWGAFTYTGAP